MKARLLIGLVTCLAMLAILAGVTTTKAHADAGNNTITCGSNPGKYARVASASHTNFTPFDWHVRTDFNCGLNGGWLTELQHNTGTGGWTDLIEFNFITPAGRANQDDHQNYNFNGFSCNASVSYRFKTWSTSETTTVPVSC
jgi:hypothetical protein